MTSPDIFLSHSSDDVGAARELRAVLEAAGYTCWLAPDDVTGSQPWAEQILTAIEGCRVMLVLLSPNANSSPHVSREVSLALGRQRAVLPVRIADVTPTASLEYLLSLTQRVDAFPPPIAQHADRLIRRVAALAPLMAPPTPAVRGAIGPGSKVGPFAVEALLGEGGMATVYRATQDVPRRTVALKVIRSDRAADSEYRERFLAESQTLADLEHPNIVPIYGAGEADGQLYMAMRLVAGQTLAARLADAGRLSLRDTVATLQPIAEAIDYAHEAGVIHRDVKPANILLDSRGRPYLSDLGLGRTAGAPRGRTEPGVVFGSVDFMAPEQLSGAAVTDRTDVYALACVAYTCLTGTAPFAADRTEGTIYGHLEGPIPDPRTSRPELPAEVAPIFRRAMAKDPADRHPTAEEFLRDLARVETTTLSQPTLQISQAPKPGRLAVPLRAGMLRKVAVVAAAVLLLVGTMWVLSKDGGASATANGSKAPASGTPAPPLWVTPEPGLALRYEPAALVSPVNGAALGGPTVTFVWTLAVGPTPVRFVGLYASSTPPPQACAAVGYCQEGPDDATAGSDIAIAGGTSDGQLSATVSGLPDDGSTIYVRLYTKFETDHGYDPAAATPPDDGLYAWRDYVFTSGVLASPTMSPAPQTPSPIAPTPTPVKTFKPTKPPTPAPTIGYNPARLTGISNGATLNGATFTFTWSAASGPDVTWYYAVYIGSSGPDNPCPSSQWCKEPPDDSYSPKDIAQGLGLTERQFQTTNLPADGSTIYVRLLTLYGTGGSGPLTWRDYTFTSQP